MLTYTMVLDCGGFGEFDEDERVSQQQLFDVIRCS